MPTVELLWDEAMVARFSGLNGETWGHPANGRGGTGCGKRPDCWLQRLKNIPHGLNRLLKNSIFDRVLRETSLSG
jgi:hypothetical protein